MGHIALLSNPFSGRGRGARAAVIAIERLESMGAEVRTYAGESAEDTRALALVALAAGPDSLVVVGGDGTLTESLDALCAAKIPLVLVPAGTGDDLARALGLSLDDPAAAAALALTGIGRVIDVGEVRAADETSLFLTVAALGFDSKVSDRTNKLRWPHGRLRYYLALVIELIRLRPTRFTLSYDGGLAEDAPGTLVAVGNTASYGGGMPICRGALPDDGLFDVVHVVPLGRMRLIRLFPKLLRGTHLIRPEVDHRRVHTITAAAPDLVVYADGERVAEGSCTISVRQAALTILVANDEEITS